MGERGGGFRLKVLNILTESLYFLQCCFEGFEFLLDLPFFFAYVEALANPARVQHYPMEFAHNFSKSNAQPCCFYALAYSCWWYMQGTQISAFWVVMSTFGNDVS